MPSNSTKTEVGLPLPERIVVGRVRRVHGVAGDIVVEPLSDVDGRFAVGESFRLEDDSGRQRDVVVARCHEHPDGYRLAFEGIESREAAEEHRGSTLSVERGRVPAAPPGAFYHFELLGCRSRDEEAGDLGLVVEVADDGGSRILWTEGSRGRLPLPFVAEFLVRFDRAERVLFWKLPAGLIEACASRS